MKAHVNSLSNGSSKSPTLFRFGLCKRVRCRV